jgi:hypothetical protein
MGRPRAAATLRVNFAEAARAELTSSLSARLRLYDCQGNRRPGLCGDILVFVTVAGESPPRAGGRGRTDCRALRPGPGRPLLWQSRSESAGRDSDWCSEYIHAF